MEKSVDSGIEFDAEESHPLLQVKKDLPVQKTSRLYKFLALFLLVITNTSLVLLMRHVKTKKSTRKFLNSSAVTFCEVLKLIISFIVVIFKERSSTFKHLKVAIFEKNTEFLKLSIPALLYALQNNLIFLAVENIPASVFLILSQTKLLLAAIFSILLLNRKFSIQQWISLVLLTVGITIVQLSDLPSDNLKKTQKPLIGIAAVFISCFSSGFAGVYFEKMLKNSKVDLFTRNIQLGTFGLIFSLIGMALKDWKRILKKGIFHGYTNLAWSVVGVQAIGGIVVSLVVNYADNVLKGFAGSMSIIISIVISIYLYGTVITVNFIWGTMTVILSMILYGIYSP